MHSRSWSAFARRWAISRMRSWVIVQVVASLCRDGPAVYYRAATPLLPYPIRAHSSISWASGEGVRRWQEWQRRFTHSWHYRHLRVVISRVIAGRERAKQRGLIHTLAAIPGDAEGRKDQHSHTYRGTVYDKEERHIDDARCASNAVIMR
jgi:hypothetical protein